MAQAKKYKRFSKYLLLDHLFDGGMAEIYRARELTDQETAQVGSKIVAIKLIRQEYSADPEYKKMFEQELKVCFGFIHPNVAQTFDYGEKNNKLYAVLEYIDGRNLKQYLDIMTLQKKKFTIPMAVYITSQICLGMDYTHKFTDKLSGKAYNLIHRDISPHNIMMSFEGLVKVIDFGIAKADTNQEKTQTGVIKGKTSYLAPEYLAEGIKLDHRYDQFAVALTLWDLLFGKKLFDAKNQMAILKQVYDCNIPNPNDVDSQVEIPDELADILLKALSRDPQDRYKDMDMFNRALVMFLNKNYPEFNVATLKEFIGSLYRTEIGNNRDKLKTYGSIDVKPYLNDYKLELTGQLTVETPETAAPQEQKRAQNAATATDPHNAPPAVSPTTPPPPPPTSLRKKVPVKKSATKTGRTKIQRNRPDFARKSGQSSWAVAMVLSIIVPLVTVLIGVDIISYRDYPLVNTYLKQYEQFIPEDFKALEMTHEKGRLMIPNLAPNQQLFVENKLVQLQAARTPANTHDDPDSHADAEPFIELDMYRHVNLRLQAPGKRPVFKTIKLSMKNPVFKWRPAPARKIATGGIITTLNHSMKEYLEIVVDKNSVHYSLPIINKQELPVGRYEGKVWDRERQTFKKINFQVRRNRITKIIPES